MVAVSHGLLDAMTDGGLGVALLWPWTPQRIFFPWRPIPVAPIGLHLFSLRGLYVLGWEVLVFLPVWMLAL
jgi:inner membrane protein